MAEKFLEIHEIDKKMQEIVAESIMATTYPQNPQSRFKKYFVMLILCI